jgi:hypothetical protein
LMVVLHLLAAHGAARRLCRRFWLEVAGDGVGRREESHEPAFLQLCDVSVRWSRQKVL